MPDLTEIPCSAWFLNRTHHPAHDWQPQPGMDLVRCPGHRCACPDLPLHEPTCPATGDLWRGVAPGGTANNPVVSSDRDGGGAGASCSGSVQETEPNKTGEICHCGGRNGQHWHRCPDKQRSDIGTEFVQQADHPDTAALDEVDAELTAESATSRPEVPGASSLRAPESASPAPKGPQTRLLPWAETIDSSDGGRTVRIPWTEADGNESTGGITVDEEGALQLGTMLADYAVQEYHRRLTAPPSPGSVDAMRRLLTSDDPPRRKVRMDNDGAVGSATLHAEAPEAPPLHATTPDSPTPEWLGTECTGDEGLCPEHGFHRHSLKQPGGEPEPDDTDLTEQDIDQMMADGTPVQIAAGVRCACGQVDTVARIQTRDGHVHVGPPIGPLVKVTITASATAAGDGIDTASDTAQQLAQSGVDTPGCDCGHDGMGTAWHLKPCPHARQHALHVDDARELAQQIADNRAADACPGFKPSGLCELCGDDRRWHAARDGDLRDRLAADLYERANPGEAWAAAHPDDLLAYGDDADRALATPALRELQSELAAYRRAVAQWEVSERGTYIPMRSLAAIAEAAGIELLGARVERVEQDLAEARLWARHGYEIGHRHCGWNDHGTAPAWLTLGQPPHVDTCEHLKQAEAAEAALDRVRALAADMRTWCSPRGIATDYADRVDDAINGTREPS